MSVVAELQSEIAKVLSKMADIVGVAQPFGNREYVAINSAKRTLFTLMKLLKSSYYYKLREGIQALPHLQSSPGVFGDFSDIPVLVAENTRMFNEIQNLIVGANQIDFHQPEKRRELEMFKLDIAAMIPSLDQVMNHFRNGGRSA